MKVLVNWDFVFFYHSGLNVEVSHILNTGISQSTYSTYMSRPEHKVEGELFEITEEQENFHVECKGCNAKLDFPVKTLKTLAVGSPGVCLMFKCRFKGLAEPFEHSVIIHGPLALPFTKKAKIGIE